MAEESSRPIGGTQGWLSFNPPAHIKLVATEGKIVDSSDRLYTRNLGHTLDQLLLKDRLPVLVRVFAFRQLHFQRDQILRIETGVNILQPQETFYHQA